jgi:hypothetical protein
MQHERYVLQVERVDESRQILGMELRQIRDVVRLVRQAEANTAPCVKGDRFVKLEA